MVYCGVLWCILVYFGVLWCIVVYCGVLWCMVVYGGVWWCMEVYGGCRVVFVHVACSYIPYSPHGASAVFCKYSSKSFLKGWLECDMYVRL